MFGNQAVTFVNAAVLAPDGRVLPSLRIARGVVDCLGGSPQRGDVVVDVDCGIVLPGLINAHDHLELNSFGRLKWRARHVNVREWIADFQPRFGADAALADARPDTLDDRAWVGGLKNMLAGVTTVCHHNPIHPVLRRRFPVRVVQNVAISHSLLIDGDRVALTYRRTPPDCPWIIHAAEGVDAEARNEVSRLQHLRCLADNTVLVHGVGIDRHTAECVLAAGAALVWCPSSNLFLFGETADVRLFAQRRRLALGSDSRLSGAGDLLDELRAARCTKQISPEALVRTVTDDAAAVLRLTECGALLRDRPADLVVLRRVADDPCVSVVSSTRRDVRLTMMAGAPLVSDPAMSPVFAARRQPFVRVGVDGDERLLASWIARRAIKMRLREPGLEVA